MQLFSPEIRVLINSAALSLRRSITKTLERVTKQSVRMQVVECLPKMPAFRREENACMCMQCKVDNPLVTYV